MKWIVYLLAGSLFFVITSCNEVKDGSLSSVKTNLKISVPFSTVNTDQFKSQSSAANHVFNFAGEQVFSPSSIQTEIEASGYTKFKALAGAKLSLPNTLNVEDFQSLNLEWGYETTPGNFTLQNSVDLLALRHSQNNGNLEINLGNSLVQMIETMGSNYNSSYKVSIKGYSKLNYSGSGSLELPLIIETESLSTRFELW